MTKLKAEVFTTDVLAMLPAMGNMCQSREELESVGDVVGVSLAKALHTVPGRGGISINSAARRSL